MPSPETIKKFLKSKLGDDIQITIGQGRYGKDVQVRVEHPKFIVCFDGLGYGVESDKHVFQRMQSFFALADSIRGGQIMAELKAGTAAPYPLKDRLKESQSRQETYEAQASSILP